MKKLTTNWPLPVGNPISPNEERPTPERAAVFGKILTTMLYHIPPRPPTYKLLDQVVFDAAMKRQSRETVERRLRRWTDVSRLIEIRLARFDRIFAGDRGSR